MKEKKLDLTELYVSVVLKEQIEINYPELEYGGKYTLYARILDRILQEIPSESRILQALTTFPKQVSELLLEEEKQKISALIMAIWGEIKGDLEY
ncbi:MAG: hypothetical protein ACFBSG_18775 [Leptolyngbyaceae cyanobacterium]